MTAPDDEIRRLVGEARALPDGPTKLDLLDEAARIADARNDVPAGFAVRKLILAAALGGGLPEQMMVAFAWCAAQSDRHPTDIPPETILWEYRWVISELPHFPQVPRAQIEETVAEMTRRYRAAGSTLRPVHLLRTFTYVKLGDVPAATAAHRDWQQAPRDWLSDSPRQELNLTVNFLTFAGRHREAIDACPNVLAGRVDEPEFFGQDSAELLIPLLEAGRVADAARVQRSGYRYLAKKQRYLAHLGFHVEYLARVDNWAGAQKVFEEHAPLALTTKQYYDRFQFHRGCLVFLERLRRAGHDRFKFRLPDSIPVAPTNRVYDLAELAGWLRSDLADFAARFDARNGTSYFTDRLNAVADLATRPAPTG